MISKQKPKTHKSSVTNLSILTNDIHVHVALHSWLTAYCYFGQITGKKPNKQHETKIKIKHMEQWLKRDDPDHITCMYNVVFSYVCVHGTHTNVLYVQIHNCSNGHMYNLI